MLTKTEVANLALGYLGVSLTISDIDTDNSNQAKIVRRNLGTSLKESLEKHPWTFATKYQALTLFENAPSSGYAYSYSVPADCLIVREIAAEKAFINDYELYEQYKIRWQEVYSSSGVKIHTDLGNAFAKYTVNINSDFGFPTHFGRYWAAQLAEDIASSLITNNYAKVKSMLMSELSQRKSSAIADDMGRQPRPLDPPSPFVSIRGG